ncbi:PAS domain-containing protein [Microvirga roseola]|uniref:PAS domain-containing protein n=1 Tax=Microvirga roseola TaxID=2883126 RepID=UPI001E3B80B9|nr:PAS domain-containing protein [Microvirga roseola]
MANKVASLERDDKRRLAELEQRVRETEQALHETQTALRVANGKLQMALEVGKLCAWDRNLETDEMTGSATFKFSLGLPQDMVLTHDALEQMFHPGDLERIRQAIAFGVRTRTHFNIDHRFIKPDGRIIRVQVQGGAVYDGDKPAHLFGVFQDITEREKIKEEIHLAQRRQEFLLNLNDQLRDLNDPDAIMETTAQSLGQFLKVDCAGYGEVDEERGIILVEREWSKGVISNQGRAYRLYDFLPTMMAELNQGRPIHVEDIRTDPRASNPEVQTAYSTLNARSALAVPLLKNQKLTAILYLHSAGPRAWSRDELSLAEDVAERTWTAVEKARAEIDLRETDARFKVIAESLPALVWILNPKVELLYTNQRWVTYSGLSPEDALGHSWMHAIHPDDMARMTKELETVISQHTPYETEARYRSHEGVYRWHLIQGAPIHSPSGEFKGWVGTSVDIHNLKETEAALRESEERLALAQRTARIGVFDWDVSTGRIIWTSEQERMFNLEPGSFEGTYEGWSTRVHPADVAAFEKDFAEAAARGERELPFSYRILMPEGGFRHIEGSMTVLYGPDRKPARIIGVNIDVSKHKQAEARQQLLIRELHHRVKNTLATVQAIVGSTARTASSIDEFYQGFVGRIVSLARTHNLLTEDLWQKAALEDLVQTELGPYEDEARNQVLVEGPHVELPSEAAVPIGMAIHELTTNAAKHGALSTFGGKVEVSWRIEPGGERGVLHFSWTERGGPRVSLPTRQGFGSRLLQRVLTAQLQADVKMDFQEEGLRFTMVMPIPGEPPIFNPDNK